VEPITAGWHRRHYALREGWMADIRRRCPLPDGKQLPARAYAMLEALVCRDLPDPTTGLRKGYCWPTVARLQDDAGLGCVRTAQRALGDLVTAGLIVRIADSGRGHSDIYVIRWDRLCPGGPGPKGDTAAPRKTGKRVTQRPGRIRAKGSKPAAGAASCATLSPPPLRPPAEMRDPAQRARWIAEQAAMAG